MSPRTALVVRGLLLSLPYAVLLALGGLWLWERGAALWFALATSVLVAVLWGVQRLSRKPVAPAPRLERHERFQQWPPAGQTAWIELERKAREIDAASFPLDDPAAWWNLFRTSIETAARGFHAKSAEPMLEVPVPQILGVAELVARDLRQAILTQIPGSHVLTVNDLRRLHAVAQWLPALSRLVRVGSFLINPVTGLAREAGNLVQGKLVQASTVELKQWLLGFLIQQTGFYAIELYSGGLTLDLGEAGGGVGGGATSGVAGAPPATKSTATVEPLRVLVCGQVKAGKSSLVNSLFSDLKEAPRAAADVLPTTDRATAHTRLMTDPAGLPAAVIVDTPGYADVDLGPKAIELVRKELPQCDIVLLVVSALSAARQADRDLLEQFRAIWREKPDRLPAVTLVVLTHIDQLRPHREWSPPYNIVQAESAKAKSIRAAVDAVTVDLGLEPGDVIPVCTHPERVYNVQEGLVPALLQELPEARRAACLRTLRDRQSAETWSLWRTQAESAGQLLKHVGAHLGRRAVEEARAAADRYLLGDGKR